MRVFTEIDVVLIGNETIAEAMSDMIEKAGVEISWMLINEAGPTGHPNVVIAGTEFAIKQFTDAQRGI